MCIPNNLLSCLSDGRAAPSQPLITSLDELDYQESQEIYFSKVCKKDDDLSVLLKGLVLEKSRLICTTYEASSL